MLQTVGRTLTYRLTDSTGCRSSLFGLVGSHARTHGHMAGRMMAVVTCDGGKSEVCVESQCCFRS